MVSKLFVVLFALLAVQASAGVAPFDVDDVESKVIDALVDVNPNLIESLIDLVPEFPEESSEEDEEIMADPNKCVQHIQEAYNVATEVKRIVTGFRGLGKGLVGGLKKCKDLGSFAERRECARNAWKATVNQVRQLVQSWKTVKPKIGAVYDKFTKCLAFF